MDRKKVYLIDEADRMNQEAANSFLKTLEEPPADSILILITSRPFALLSTIVSRCQRLRFQPLTSAQIRQFLSRTASLSGEDAKMLALISLGRLGIVLETSVDGIREELADFASLLSPDMLQQPVKITEAASHWSTDIETTKKALLWISFLASRSNSFSNKLGPGKAFLSSAPRKIAGSAAESRSCLGLLPFHRGDQPRPKPEYQSSACSRSPSDRARSFKPRQHRRGGLSSGPP